MQQCLQVMMHFMLRIFPETDKRYYDKFKDTLTLYDDKHLIDHVNVGLAVPKYVQNIDSIKDLKDDKDFGKSVDWTIQGTDNRNGVMQQTNDELDRDDLSKYSLDKSSDQEQFKKIQKHINNNNLFFSHQWNQIGSRKN